MEVGAIIGEQYTVVEHIGRGGMADVWSARDQRLRRMVAIKTIAVGLTQDIDPVSLFRNEAQTIASMEHPHILPIYDFGEHAGALYIVMRFVTGGSLENLMQAPMPPAEVLRIGEAIASALDYAHANKIIHLDLKPPNILMDSGGAPYLADFGLATVLDPEGRARNPGSGTLLYMAPEQLTSELIDHHADIYSFSIMMFHMLTGKLPYDGMIPMALRQIQFNDELPPVEERVPSLPASINDVLRRGTAKDLADRPRTLMAIVDDLRAILQPGGARSGVRVLDEEDLAVVDAVNMQTERLLSLGDPDLLEAVDIYARARYNWAGGQGRFLVSLTHFLIMSNYYVDARRYDLPVDQVGYQMLLRGALEYDHDAAFWWAANSDDDRRWVCLHTVRSGTTPARIRAMYRLETLPDDEKTPVIPKLVAQALEVERDTDARLAALHVLTTRAKLVKEGSAYQIRTEFMGRLLTTMTRLGIEVTPTTLWRDPVYTPEIDLMIAEQALDTTTPTVAEAAARSVGRMHSLVGVRHLANEQRSKRGGALQALALVRDEVPSLPDVVSAQARAYAWITNTLRRITDRPLDLILRFALAVLGGWIAFGLHIYSTYYALELFSPRRWGNSIATGLTVGVFIGLIVIVTDEMSARLRGFWTWWLRLLLGSVLGITLGILTWSALRWFYYSKIPSWDLMRLGGAGLALGFVLVSIMNLPRWKALFLPAFLIYVPIFIAYPNECLQDYGCTFADNTLWLPAFNYFPVAGVGLALGVLIGWFIPRRSVSVPLVNLPPMTKLVLSGAVGALWCGLVWWSYIVIYQQNLITYDYISLWFFGSLFFGLVLAAFMQRAQTLAFVSVGLVSMVLLGVISTQAIFGTYTALNLNYADPTYYVAPQKELGVSGDRDSLLNYANGNPTGLLTIGIPMVLVLALGAYVQSTYASIAAFVGQPVRYHRGRDPWLASALAYTLFVSAVISVFALFSIHVSIPYGIGWSLWGFLTFVSALAAWRWARWGAWALLGLGILLIVGGAIYDVLTTASLVAEIQRILALPLEQQPRTLPITLLDQSVMLSWGMWSVVVGIFALAALRRQLWGGIGLVVMTVAWYLVTLSGILPSFATIQVLANLALIAYALQPSMHEMEQGRWTWKLRRPMQKRTLPSATAAPVLTTLPLEMPLAQRISLAQEQQVATMATQMDVTDTLDIPSYRRDTVLDAPSDADIAVVRAGMPPTVQFEADEAVTPADTQTDAPKAMPPTVRFEDGEGLPDAPPNPLPSAPRLKFDTRGLKGRSAETHVDKPTPNQTAQEKPRLKFDASALTDKANLVTRVEPPLAAPKPAPRLKFDTNALQPKAADTKSKRPGLRFDTSALDKPTPAASEVTEKPTDDDKDQADE